MKAFCVLYTTLLIYLEVVSSCPQGFKGDDCEVACTLDCNRRLQGGLCGWQNNTQVCICDETKWTGPNCEESHACVEAQCNYGRCQPTNDTDRPFVCVCDEGFRGEKCTEKAFDLCIGQSKLACENGAKCAQNKCLCNDGFGGALCDIAVPSASAYESARCEVNCSKVFGNERCDENCNTPECFYDGLDCREKVDLPWSPEGGMQEGARWCLRVYGNEVCNVECNLAEYGFDGGDCDKAIKGTVMREIEMTLKLRPPEVFIVQRSLLAYLAQVSRSVVTVSMRNERAAHPMISEPKIFPSTKYNGSTTVVLSVDSTYCTNETWRCLQLNSTEGASIESLVVLLENAFVRAKSPLLFAHLNLNKTIFVDEVQIAQAEEATALLEMFVAVISSMVVSLLLVMAMLACYVARRQRRFRKNSRDGGKPKLYDHRKSRLMVAVEEGNVSTLTTLLAEVTPSEAANAEDVSGNTVLHLAAARDDKVVVRLLLQSRMFDVCAANAIGQSPLLYSLREGSPGLETLTLIVNAVNDEKLRQRTTSRAARPAVSHLLMSALSEESGYGLTDLVGRSALHYAALAGRAPLVHFLVAHGASPGLQDASGNTPLHLAAINGHADTVRALLQESAAVTVTNSLGNTPSQVCALNGHAQLAAVLREEELRVSSPPLLRPRRESTAGRGAMYSTAESVFSVETEEDLVLPSLLPSFSCMVDAAGLGSSSCSRSSAGAAGCCPPPPMPSPISSSRQPNRLSMTGVGGTSGGLLLSPASSGGAAAVCARKDRVVLPMMSSEGVRMSDLSDATDGLQQLQQSTPKPSLPHILTPSSQLVEISPDDRHPTPSSTMPRKSLWGVERSPSDPRPVTLSSPYCTTSGYGKRRSFPDGQARDAMLMSSPGHFSYATNTLSSASERSASSTGAGAAAGGCNDRHDSLVSSFKPLS